MEGMVPVSSQTSARHTLVPLSIHFFPQGPLKLLAALFLLLDFHPWISGPAWHLGRSGTVGGPSTSFFATIAIIIGKYHQQHMKREAKLSDKLPIFLLFTLLSNGTCNFVFSIHFKSRSCAHPLYPAKDDGHPINI